MAVNVSKIVNREVIIFTLHLLKMSAKISDVDELHRRIKRIKNE